MQKAIDMFLEGKDVSVCHQLAMENLYYIKQRQ